MLAEGPDDGTRVQASRKRLACTLSPLKVNTHVAANTIHTEETVKRLSASFPFCIIHRPPYLAPAQGQSLSWRTALWNISALSIMTGLLSCHVILKNLYSTNHHMVSDLRWL